MTFYCANYEDTQRSYTIFGNSIKSLHFYNIKWPFGDSRVHGWLVILYITIFSRVLRSAILHARIQNILSNCANVFLVDKGREDPNTTISGPSSARQWNAIKWRSLACWWLPNIECWLGSFVIFSGSGPNIAKKPYILWFFRGGGRQMFMLINSIVITRRFFCVPMTYALLGNE